MNLASQKQRAMFFALSNELGYEADKVKERAKKHFNLESFKDATSDQLNYLIDRLLEKQLERFKAKHKHETPEEFEEWLNA